MLIITSICFSVYSIETFAWRKTTVMSDGDSVFFSGKNWGSLLNVSVKPYQTTRTMANRTSHFTIFIQPERNSIFLGDKGQGRFYRHFFRHDDVRISITAYNPDGSIAGQIYRQGYDNYVPSVKNSFSKGSDRISFEATFNDVGTGRIVITFSYRYNWEHAKGYVSSDEALIFNFSTQKEIRIEENDGSDNTISDLDLEDDLFVPLPPLNIEASVDHTDKWNENREEFNMWHFKKSETGNITYQQYLQLTMPRLRFYNVFWSGEKFVLSANVLSGECYSISVSIDGTDYGTNLVEAGSNWIGEIWDENMREELFSETPKELLFVFSAIGNTNDEKKASIILDDDNQYWELHRVE